MKDSSYYKRKFFNTAVADIYHTLDGRIKNGSFILSFCLMDYLTWLEFGHDSANEEYFSKWIEKRLLPLNSYYKEIGKELWSYRCGFIHTYGPSKRMIKEKEKCPGYTLYFENVGMHLTRVNNPILKICLYTMLTEIVYAAHLFFEEIKTNYNQDVLNRLEMQIKILGEEPPVLFKEMHKGLGVFDEPGDITLMRIRGYYTAEILYPDLG